MGFTQDYGIDPAQVGIAKVENSPEVTGNGNELDSIDVAKSIIAGLAKEHGMDAAGALELLEKAKEGPIASMAGTPGFDGDGNAIPATISKAKPPFPPFKEMAGKAGYDEKGFPAPQTMKGKPPFPFMAGKPGYSEKGMPMPFKEMANKAGYNADGMPDAGVGHAQMTKSEGEGGDAGTNVPTQKAMVQVMEDGSVLVAGQAVSKARHFTPERTDALASVVGSLVKLLNDVDPSAIKALEENAAKGGTPLKIPDMPKDTKVPSMVQPTGTGAPALAMSVTKSEDGTEFATIAKADLDKLLTVNERLEAIEKARAPSQSVEGDGGTETKVEKSLWAGVL